MLIHFFKYFYKSKVTFLPFIKLNEYFFLYNYTMIFNKVPLKFDLILKNQINFLNLLKEAVSVKAPFYLYSSTFSYGYVYSLNFLLNIGNRNLNRLQSKKGSVVLLFENNIKQNVLKEFGGTIYTNLYILPYSTISIKKNLTFYYLLVNLENDLYKYVYANFIKYFLYKQEIFFKKKNLFTYMIFFKKIYKIK